MHQAFHIFKYLKNRNNSCISLDSSKVDVEWKGLHEHLPDARRAMMKKIYQDASKDVPVNAPLSRGKCFSNKLLCRC